MACGLLVTSMACLSPQEGAGELGSGDEILLGDQKAYGPSAIQIGQQTSITDAMITATTGNPVTSAEWGHSFVPITLTSSFNGTVVTSDVVQRKMFFPGAQQTGMFCVRDEHNDASFYVIYKVNGQGDWQVAGSANAWTRKRPCIGVMANREYALWDETPGYASDIWGTKVGLGLPAQQPGDYMDVIFAVEGTSLAVTATIIELQQRNFFTPIRYAN